jgi:hypothetical protein
MGHAVGSLVASTTTQRLAMVVVGVQKYWSAETFPRERIAPATKVRRTKQKRVSSIEHRASCKTHCILYLPIGACKENSGPISAGSCGAYNACCSNTAEIGEGQCNTAGQCSNCNGQGTTSSESSPTQKPNTPMTFAPSYYPSYVPTKTNSGKT